MTHSIPAPRFIVVLPLLDSIADYGNPDIFPQGYGILSAPWRGQQEERLFRILRDSRISSVSATLNEEEKAAKIIKEVVIGLDGAIRDKAKRVKSKYDGGKPEYEHLFMNETSDKGPMIARVIECNYGTYNFLRRNIPDAIGGELEDLYLVVCGTLYLRHSNRFPPGRRIEWPSDPETIVASVNATVYGAKEYRKLTPDDLWGGADVQLYAAMHAIADGVIKHCLRYETLGLTTEKFDELTPTEYNREAYKHCCKFVKYPDMKLLAIYGAAAVESCGSIEKAIDYCFGQRMTRDLRGIVRYALSAFLADCYIRGSWLFNVKDFKTVFEYFKTSDLLFGHEDYQNLNGSNAICLQIP